MRILRDLEEHLSDGLQIFWIFWLVVIMASVLVLIVGSASIASRLHTKGEVKFAAAGTANVGPAMKIAGCSNGSVSWPARSDGCHSEDAPKVYTLDQTGEFSKAFEGLWPKGLTYHPVTIADMIATDPANWSRAMHTHITVEGWLTYFAHEADGDIHLRLCDAATIQGVDRKHCVVGEIIPELPMKAADALILGKKLRVSGNYRYDAEGGCKQAKPSHCWHEVHPVRALEIVQ